MSQISREHKEEEEQEVEEKAADITRRVGESNGRVSHSGDRFSHLYCGCICEIQSFLYLDELLHLSKVNRHYRNVASGNINPSGVYRIGKDVPYIHWSAVIDQRKKPQQAVTAAAASPDFSSCSSSTAGSCSSTVGDDETANSSANTVNYWDSTISALRPLVHKDILQPKHLQRPPFLFLLDIVTELIASKGFPKGLFDEASINRANTPFSIDQKVQFLGRLIDSVELARGRMIDVDPSNIIVGLECEKTNAFLQELARAACGAPNMDMAALIAAVDARKQSDTRYSSVKRLCTHATSVCDPDTPSADLRPTRSTTERYSHAESTVSVRLLTTKLANSKPSDEHVFSTLFDEYNAQRIREALPVLSPEELDAFIAMTPAPAYRAPASGRHLFINGVEQFDQLLLSPILSRHIQGLQIEGDFRVPQFHSLLKRLPFLQNLDLKMWSAQWNPPSDLLWPNNDIQLRFPSSLRSLRMSVANNNPTFGTAFEYILSLLPAQCPQLQELICPFVVPDSEMLPLLQLQNLTRLELSSSGGEIEEFPFANVLRQLTKLKYLNVLDSNMPVVHTCLPSYPNALEEFTIPPNNYLVEADLSAVADSAPQLTTVSIRHCQLVDHSTLSRFRNIRNLTYNHVIQGFHEVDEDDGSNRSPLAADCIAAHGSLEHHISHVIHVISSLPDLTNLTVEHLYSAPAARSAAVNSAYFASRNMTYSKRRAYENDALEPAVPISIDSLSFYHPAENALHRNSVYQLAALLPQLTSLSLAEYSAWHLPSLSFVAHLRHLTSLSISEAHHLPIESLYDLHHVSSTLTSLTLKQCFPVDCVGRDVYLLHDVLKPLQFSHPITQAASIQFAAHLVKNGSDSSGATTSSDSVSSSASSSRSSAVGATITFEDAASSSISNDVVSSVPISIPPRSSSWYEIRNIPLVDSNSCVTLMLRSLRIRRDHHTFDGETPPTRLRYQHPRLRGHYDFWQLQREGVQLLPYRMVFDSFSVEAPDNEIAKTKLTSRLLPNLLTCDIQHDEPNIPRCVFHFDRRSVPRYELTSSNGRATIDFSIAYVSHLLADERQLMQSMFNMKLSVAEIKGMSYLRFLENFRPNQRYQLNFLAVSEEHLSQSNV